MKRSSDYGLPQELADVAERLRTNRAQLTPLELDRIKLASRGRAAGKPSIKIKREERIVMRTRVNILAVLVAGIVFSGAGAAMGISGLASNDGAGNAQYQNAVVPQGPGEQGTQGQQQGVKGAHTTLGGQTVNVAGANASRGGVKGAHARSGTAPAAVAQPTRQRAVSSGSLPFTGYAAIPVFLIGLGLLGTGMVMRRRTASDES